MLHDISVVVRTGTPEWPGDTPYTCGWTWKISDGASVNVSAFTMSPHVGTHADAPVHVRDGWPAADALPLPAFIGRARVIDASAATGAIDAEELAAFGDTSGAERILLKTGRTIAAGAFPEAWPTLSEGCARALAAGGVRLVGVDCPSVDARESKTLPVHHALFAAGAYVLENLDLSGVDAGDYELLAAPLRMHALDAAPVRAVLRALP